MVIEHDFAIEAIGHLDIFDERTALGSRKPASVGVELATHKATVQRRRSMNCIPSSGTGDHKPLIRRRVSFSEQPPRVSEVHGADEYNRRILEGLEGNFSVLQLCLIQLDIERAKREMAVHPDSDRTSRGLPAIDLDEVAEEITFSV